MESESLKYWIALKAVEEVGCIGFKTLLASFPSPRAVFNAPFLALKAVPGIGAKTAGNIRSFSNWEMAEREVAKAEALGIDIVTCDDPCYPRNLLNIYDYPPYLYMRGFIHPDEVCVAIVGSRLSSAYGRYVTEKLSRELAMRGVTVVSGLARGIDAAAHRGALAGKGRTIAVLGCGLDVIYPPENERLAEAVAADGALVTEFPLGTAPNAPNFPSRNRIISGISLGVVVVEAGEKSGSLITARIAAEQGRSVFAVPGAIEAAGSRGTNRLIKQGAKLIENVEDILEEILPQAGIPSTAAMISSAPEHPRSPISEVEKPAGPLSAHIGNLPEQEEKLLLLISREPVTVDTLIARSGFTSQEVLNALLLLELKGLVLQLPGKAFILKELQH